MICVEWADDHIGLFDVDWSTFDEDARKTIFTFSFPVTLTFDLYTSNSALPSYSCPALFPLS